VQLVLRADGQIIFSQILNQHGGVPGCNFNESPMGCFNWGPNEERSTFLRLYPMH
jgi:hypothetical protein